MANKAPMVYAHFPPFETVVKGKQELKAIKPTPLSYVVGFLFDDEGNVALIRKTKPKWQNGFLNGIGGKIEPNETPTKAMRREFLEETGAGVLEWRLFRILRLKTGGSVYFYVAHGKRNLQTTTDEEVGWYKLSSLKRLKTIPNLQRLIPEAVRKHMDDIGVQVENLDDYENQNY